MAWAGSFAVGGLHCAAGWATRIVGGIVVVFKHRYGPA